MRPAVLTDGAKTGRYRVLTDLTGQRMTQISRQDVADFLVRETLTPGYRNVAINLTE